MRGIKIIRKKFKGKWTATLESFGMWVYRGTINNVQVEVLPYCAGLDDSLGTVWQVHGNHLGNGCDAVAALENVK